MRLPRDWSGADLIRRLERLGYQVTRQTGSHVRLSHAVGETVHHITVPNHRSLRVGTLNNILNDVASHLDVSKDELLRQLQ